MSKTNPKPTDYVLVTMSSKDIYTTKLAIDIALDAAKPSHSGLFTNYPLTKEVIKTLENLAARLSQYEKARKNED